jgi:hypothetical protein
VGRATKKPVIKRYSQHAVERYNEFEGIKVTKENFIDRVQQAEARLKEAYSRARVIKVNKVDGTKYLRGAGWYFVVRENVVVTIMHRKDPRRGIGAIPW